MTYLVLQRALARTRASLVLFALGAAALSAACRERTALCGEDECRDSSAVAGAGFGGEPPMTDAAGAGAEPRAGAPSAAGSADGGEDEPECKLDSDCPGGAPCSGVAICEDGRCSTVAPECPAPTHCVDVDGDFACELTRPARWILYQGDDLASTASLIARPLEYLDSIEPIDLTRGIDTTGYVYTGAAYNDAWSPDGRFLIVESGTSLPDLLNRFSVVEFGAGLPKPARSLEELPHPAGLVVASWSLDSKRLLVLNYGSQYEGYLVDLERGTTSLAFADEFGDGDPVFCADSRLLLRDYPDGRYLLDLEQGSKHPVALGLSPYTFLSPDRRWLVASEDGIGRVVACSPDSSPVELGAGDLARWSADSRWLAFGTDWGPFTVYDASAGFEAQVTFEPDDVNWAPRAARVAFADAATDETTLVLIDFEGDPELPRLLSTIPTGVESLTWVNDELLAYGTYADDESYEAHLVRTIEPYTDRLLARFPADAPLLSLLYDPLARYAFFVLLEGEGERQQLYALSLTRENAVPEPVFETPVDSELDFFDILPDAGNVIVREAMRAAEPSNRLWLVPFDETGVGRPAPINRGKDASFVTLQPRP